MQQTKNMATILIVDDNAMNRKLLDRMITPLGHKAISADNGLAALSIIKTEPPDLVLLDILMPEMDGYEVLEKIKSDPARRHIPVIMITAIDDIESAAKCIEKGADDYLAKPFNPTILKARIAGSLEKKRMHDEILLQQKQAELELQVAEAVQHAMLPSKDQLDKLPHCTVEAYYRAASSIGGDFYHFKDCGGTKVGFLIADVSGHGPSAALIVSAIKTIIETDMQNRPSPSRLIETLNRKLCKIVPDAYFATVFFGIVDFEKQTLTYASAGHPSQFLVGEGRDEPLPLTATGMMAGMFEDADYGEVEINCNADDKLILFTDGAYEIVNKAGEMFGVGKLQKLVQSLRSQSCVAIIRNIVKAIDGFWDGDSDRDDIAIVAVELTGLSSNKPPG